MRECVYIFIHRNVANSLGQSKIKSSANWEGKRINGVQKNKPKHHRPNWQSQDSKLKLRFIGSTSRNNAANT